MRELTKSVVSSSWALSLFGAHQLACLLSNDRQCGSLSSRVGSLDAVTGVARSNLSKKLQHIYDVGDDAQRGMVDLAGSALHFDVAGLIKPSIDVANPFVEGLAAVAPRCDWLIDWQELRNKIDIFDLVRNIKSRLAISGSESLVELIERAYGLGDFHALWAVEGLGHYYAKRALECNLARRGLLSDPHSLGIPEKCLLMLNAGIGLAFAEMLLDNSKPTDDCSAFDQTVARFVELCLENATPGYAGAAYESLGLVTRTYYPELLHAVDRAVLDRSDLDLLGYFWHGAGRANYFAARNFLPCKGISWNKLIEQSSHEIGKHNLVAGLAWAVTLVNMLTPSVMEKLLRVRGSEIVALDADAFAQGVAASIVMRIDTSPGAEFLASFCHYTDSHVSLLWQELIGHPCEEASRIYHPALSRQRRLEQAFRFQMFFGGDPA